MSDIEQNEANEICPVCLDTLVDKSIKVLRFCKHKVCQECFEQLLKVKGDDIEKTVKSKCPLCRGPLRLYDVSTCYKSRQNEKSSQYFPFLSNFAVDGIKIST